MSQVALYTLTAEVLERDFTGQLFVDEVHEFVRDDGTEYVLRLPDGTVNRALSFPGIDGLTDLLVRPVQGTVAVTVGPIIYNQRHKVPPSGTWGFIGAEPLDPSSIFLTYNPGDSSTAIVKIYYAGLVGATIVPPPPPPPVDFVVGTFTVTGHGFVSNPTGIANYAQFGPLVVITLPALNDVSNATTFTITGLPSSLVPSITEDMFIGIIDNDAEAVGLLKLTSGSQTLEVFSSFAGTEENPFVAAGHKGIEVKTITYQQL